MNKRIKKKWLTALRSGEYVQGKGALCKKGEKFDTFCCLGVLTDIYLREKGEGWEYKGGVYQNGIEICFLTPSVQEWAGLVEYNPQVEDESLNDRSLSAINDNGATFKKIAKLIENNL